MLYDITDTGGNTLAPKEELVLKAERLSMRKGERYDWCRYVGLNLHSWMYRGTVEWRMKEASVELEELVTWPVWCGWFVEATSRMTEAESRAKCMDLVTFTERWMPRWVTDWVERKVMQRGKPMEHWAEPAVGHGAPVVPGVTVPYFDPNTDRF